MQKHLICLKKFPSPIITQWKFAKNQNGPRTSVSVIGPEWADWGKKPEQKISWDCPFKFGKAGTNSLTKYVPIIYEYKRLEKVKIFVQNNVEICWKKLRTISPIQIRIFYAGKR